MKASRISASHSGPVAHSDRIASLDVLRGFAVLGILVVNIQSFSMIGAAYVNPTSYGDLTGANYAVWLLGHVLVDKKLIAIFSMLFGAGIVLMTSRREAAGDHWAGVHYLRMVVLLFIGLGHAYLLWYGDVLYAYAMCGFVVCFCRHWRPGHLLTVGMVLILIPVAISIFLKWSMPYWPPERLEEILTGLAPSAERVVEEMATYRGGWIEQLADRARKAFFFQTVDFLLAMMWRSCGLMLIGMALFKLGVFSAKRSSAFYLALIAAAAIVGIPLIIYGVHRSFAVEWNVKHLLFGGGRCNYFGSILVSLGWVGLVMLVCKSDRAKYLVRPFAAAGRMALTNYLLQSVICTTIFYGHGFGLFGRVERLGQIAIVLTVWAFQLIVSVVWIGRFRFGPAEWLWRSVTYMKLQPMHRGM